jgi:hypothetical protein
MPVDITRLGAAEFVLVRFLRRARMQDEVLCRLHFDQQRAAGRFDLPNYSGRVLATAWAGPPRCATCDRPGPPQ